MLSSGDQTKDLLRKTYFVNVIYNFGFKFQPVDPVLLRRVHQKLNFLTHLIAYAWIQNISK